MTGERPSNGLDLTKGAWGWDFGILVSSITTLYFILWGHIFFMMKIRGVIDYS